MYASRRSKFALTVAAVGVLILSIQVGANVLPDSPIGDGRVMRATNNNSFASGWVSGFPTAADDFTIEGFVFLPADLKSDSLVTFFRMDGFAAVEFFVPGRDNSASPLVAVGRGVAPETYFGDRIPLSRDLLGTWFYLAFMHDNSVPELRTYINGNLESGSPSTIPSVPTTTPRIGGAVDVNIFGDRKRPLDAGFKEICISNVTRYFGLTHSVPTTAKTPDANTVAQWSFADEVGSRLFMDSSGNGNHLVGALSAQMVATGGPPSIKVSPGRVRVEAMVGSNAVIAAPLKLQNVTGSAIGYEMVTNSPFTTFLPPSGTIPAGQSVDVSAGIVTVGLDRNIYDFNIRAKNTARPGVDFFNVPTRLTMYNAGPRIDMFWPPTLTGRDTLPLLVQTGQTRGVSFTIENVGTADFDVTPTTNYGPLRSQLPGATMLMPGEQLPVSLSFDATAVTPRLLDINFGARGMATNSPQRLFMPTTVYESGPGLHLGPETLKVYAEVGQTPPTRGFVISNPGTMPVDFSIVDNAAWVTLDPPSGTLSPLESQVIRVDFTRSDFPVGVFRPLVTATGVGVGGFRRSTIELSVGEILP